VIDFTAGPAFKSVPLQTVLAWRDAGDTDALQRTFAGKAVLLGSTFRFDDTHPAPVNVAAWKSDAASTPGVLLHAQALRSLLNDGLIEPVAWWIPVVLAVAAALLGLWAARPIGALALLVLVAAVCLIASTLALHGGMVLPVSAVLLVALASVGGRQAIEGALVLRERRRLRRVFDGYVSPAIMRSILAGTLDPALGGTRQFGCVLFSDLRGYTRRSEHMTPEQTIAFLNGYYAQIVPLIHEHGGTVISIMGDGIMAVFGVPQPLPNPCADAFAVAHAMLRGLRDMNVQLARKGEAPLDIGIGLHAGEGVAGHVGAATRHEYTFIGDVTNVASRLEGLTKEVGYQLVCSHLVADRLGDRTDLVALGARAVKGHSALEVFGYRLPTPTLPCSR